MITCNTFNDYKIQSSRRQFFYNSSCKNFLKENAADYYYPPEPQKKDCILCQYKINHNFKKNIIKQPTAKVGFKRGQRR